MLYNEAWSKSKVEVKADPFSLESLIAWLEKMPGDGLYEYENPDDCVLCQYFTAHGLENVSVGPWYFSHSGTLGRDIELPICFQNIASAEPRECTFGAALTRAREALASRA